jgi:hypothetical protein
MSRNILRSFIVILALGIAGSLSAQQDAPPAGQAQSQGQGQGRRGMGGPPPVIGTITTVGVDRFELKKADGTTQTVMVNDQTHIRQRQPGQQQPQELHLEDLKVGDHVAVRSAPDASSSAPVAMVNRLTDEEYQRIQSGGGPGGPGGGRFGGGGGMGPGGGGPRAGGEIVSISGNQIKVQSRRNGERVIVVNDQTTFMKEGKAITLKDLKVGDRIFARGEESNGQFVATEVRSGMPGGGRGGQQGPPPQN